MSLVRRSLEALRRARFAMWAARARGRLRVHGMALALETRGAVRWQTLPALEVDPRGGPGGTLTVRLGDDVQLGRELILDVRTGRDSTVELGEGTIFQAGCRLALYGGRIAIGDHAFVRDHVQIKVTGGDIEMGPKVQLGREVNLDAASGIRLGAQAGLAERTSIVDSDHGHDGTDAFFMDQPLRADAVEIGANTFVAANCIVLRGTVVGANAVVGAGALLRGEQAYEGGWLYAGVPARPVRPLTG